jgi:holo-[acyl-carrier protein] synthase
MMERRDQLRATVAEFLETEPADLRSDFPLAGVHLGGSLARARLDAAIRRRIGVKARAVYSAKTYGELEAAVCGTSTEDSPAAARAPKIGLAEPSRNGANGSPCSCGVDVELVANLPAADDYWEHEFYKTNFTGSEIAYCLTQQNPREHFAARWAAKEALKKSVPAYLHVEMADIEIVKAEDGSPSLHHRADEGGSVRIPVAVSMTHTPLMAVAVVVRVISPPPSESVRPSSPVSEPLVAAPPRRSVGPWLIAGLAFVFSLWALVRTF